LHERRQALRILFVDADPILREFAVINLGGERATVDVAADGEAAIAAVQAHRPDIVMLDVETPKREGYEVIDRLRRQAGAQAMPIVVVTGREDVEAVERAFEAGAATFVVKPLNWRLLTLHLRYVLRAARAEQSAATQLRQLAAEGARFAAVAMARDEELRPAAVSFARAAQTALDPEAPARAA
jgi:DNA-binding response OmpR family regulator